MQKDLLHFSIIEALGDAIHVVDCDYRIILVNSAFIDSCKKNGFSVEPVGKILFEAFPFLPSSVKDEMEQVFASGETLVTCEKTQIDGKLFYTETRKIPIWEDGEVVNIITVLRDINSHIEREQERQEHLNLLENLGRIDSVIREANDAEDLMERVITETYDIFSCDRAWLLFPCDVNSESFTVPVEKCNQKFPSVRGKSFPRDAQMQLNIERALSSRGPLLAAIGGEIPVAQLAANEFFVQSEMYMTLYPRRGQPWLFGLHQCSYERTWTAAEKNLFNEIGHRLTDSLSSMLLLKDLRASETLFRSVVTQAVDILLIFDTEGNIVDANEMASEETGFSIQELTSMKIHELEGGNRTEEERQKLLEFSLAEEALTLSGRYKRKDGSTFPVEIRSGSIVVDDKTYLLALVRNVTEREKASRAQLHSGAITRAIAKATVNFLEDRSLASMCQSLVSDALRLFSAESGLIARIDGNGELVPIYSTDKDISPLEKTIREVVASGEPIFCSSQQAGKAGKEETMVVLPLRIGSEVLGAFLLKNRPGGFGTKERKELDNFVHTAVLGLQMSITEKRRQEAQDQLRHSQKMQAVGQLAGGIAHDFNNLLLAIQGYTDLVLLSVEPDSPLQEHLSQVIKAAKRASTLTRQLLAYSRRQQLHPVLIDLNDTISNLMKMLRRLIGVNIDLDIHPGLNLGMVSADPGQIEQVLLNLVVNARDAVGEEGQVTISTKNCNITKAQCAPYPNVQPGSYVALSVQDTGLGIEEENLSRIFEPFFTTKEVGKGTGLGLATVYGIIEQHGGFIDVESEVGKGTTFHVYLPFVETARAEAKEERAKVVRGGTETILVAEDEEMVRILAQSILERAGYNVLLAENGKIALDIFLARHSEISLVILDVIMPVMGGKAAMNRMRDHSPEMPFLFLSGYAANAVIEEAEKDERMRFLPKPYRQSDLLQVVRTLIDLP